MLEADWIVLGPGSWFTSVIPHLLVPKLAEAIHATAARRILTLNLEPSGETAGFSAAKHIELLADHAPDLRLDVVLADSGFAFDDPHLASRADSLGARLVVADLAARDGSPRHDPLRLASAYAEILGVEDSHTGCRDLRSRTFLTSAQVATNAERTQPGFT